MTAEPSANAPQAVRPGDTPERLRSFFDAAMAEVYPYLARRCGHDRATAEDLTQEAFATAVRALRDGRVESLTVGWLITCAQSRFIDHHRKLARRERHLEIVWTAPEPLENQVVGQRVVAELLATLPASQRLVVVLHHLDGLTVPEVAERTGRSVRAVESLLARARRKMRESELEDPHGD